ncbi:hypothetical protein AB0L00_04375 [Actinoallomurus sp. NPDC052308]|uniref:hypothetical protein n=1 Tax=Actinoallomurus sp. NPDC052308 TaxID=3155530 RepID=UPI00341D3F9E
MLALLLGAIDPKQLHDHEQLSHAQGYAGYRSMPRHADVVERVFVDDDLREDGVAFGGFDLPGVKDAN